MNRWWGRWALLGMMALGGSALAQGRPGASQQLPEQHPGKRNPYAEQASELSRRMVADSLPGVLSQLHDINQTEIALGELTHQKGSSPTVQQYGEHMVQDHQKADQQLQQFARQHGITLNPLMEPANDTQRRLRGLTEATKAALPVLQGSLYDQEYLASQVAAHDQAIQLVTLARQQYPDLAPLLDGLLPTLREHRNQAYQLLGQTQPQAQTSQQPAQQRQARPPAGGKR